MDHSVWKSIAIVFIGVASTGVIIWTYRKITNESRYNRTKKKAVRRTLAELKTSSDWQCAGKIKKMWLYPVKSCAGISVEEAVIEKSGAHTLKCRDRSFIIIDDNNMNVSAVKISSTLKIKPELNEAKNTIVLKFPELQPLEICMSSVEKEGLETTVCVSGQMLSGFDCGEEAAKWLFLALGRKCRLLYHGSALSSMRSIEHLLHHPFVNSDDNAIYAYFGGCLLITEASLKDVERRTSLKHPAQDFRPNLLVENTRAYDEDDWTYMKIGEAVFRNAKPCGRCTFTTINHETGERHPGLEPFKTLKTYRCPEGTKEPNLGIYIGVDQAGRVRVGDSVFVLRD